MRELTVEEIRTCVIGGGVENMSKVLVTASELPTMNYGFIGFPNPGTPGLGMGPGGMVGGGGGGGGSATTFLTSKQMQELLKGVAQEIQLGITEGVIPSNWLEGGLNIANLAQQILVTNLSDGFKSYTLYQNTGFAPNGTGMDQPIDWANVDWSLFANPSATYQQALESMYQYALKKDGDG